MMLGVPVHVATPKGYELPDEVAEGQEVEYAERKKTFHRYQVNESLMALAKPDALFMHCLPAHRGEEVTDDVIESPASVVFDQAENRLHAQKALMVMLFGGR
jgi:ornithine carbamoyltransferase